MVMITGIAVCVSCLLTAFGSLTAGTIGVGVVLALLDAVLSYLKRLIRTGIDEVGGISLEFMISRLTDMRSRLESKGFSNNDINEMVKFLKRLERRIYG